MRGLIGQLKSAIMGSTSLPTEIQTKLAADARPALDKVVQDANALIARMSGLLKELAASGIYPVPPKPISPSGK